MGPSAPARCILSLFLALFLFSDPQLVYKFPVVRLLTAGQQRMDQYPAVQHPPAGAFTREDLHWDSYTYRAVLGKQAVIPTSRLPDFLAGENKRGSTQFYIRTPSRAAWLPAEGAARSCCLSAQ